VCVCVLCWNLRVVCCARPTVAYDVLYKTVIPPM